MTNKQNWRAEFRGVIQDNRAVGHASVFGQVASIRGGLERIHPNAFDRALAEKHDVVMLFNHDGLPLGRTSSGTLRLSVDDNGLSVDNDLPDTTLGHDLRVLMERGDLRQMSFGFIPTADKYEEVAGRQVRTITDLDLVDVSIVTFPAYDGTDVALRAMEFYAVPLGPSNRARATVALHRAKALLAHKEQ